MLNIEIGKIRDSVVNIMLGEYVSYYWEAEDCSPTIEVFCLGSERKAIKEVAEIMVKLSFDKNAYVDFEMFNKRYYRLIIQLEKTIPLYQALAYAKVLSEYGGNQYLALGYEINCRELSGQETQLLILKEVMTKLGWSNDGYERDYQVADNSLIGRLEFYKELKGYTQITQVYPSKDGFHFGVDYRISNGSEEILAHGEQVKTYDIFHIVKSSQAEYQSIVDEIIPMYAKVAQ